MPRRAVSAGVKAGRGDQPRRQGPSRVRPGVDPRNDFDSELNVKVLQDRQRLAQRDRRELSEKMDARASGVGRRFSEARRLFDQKRKARHERRYLKESGDYLGVQGINPDTGELDVITPSDSELSASSRGPLSPNNGNGSGVDATRMSDKALLQREIERQERLQKEKAYLRSVYKAVRWRRQTAAWSSAQQPALSPIAQSTRSREASYRKPSRLLGTDLADWVDNPSPSKSTESHSGQGRTVSQEDVIPSTIDVAGSSSTVVKTPCTARTSRRFSFENSRMDRPSLHIDVSQPHVETQTLHERADDVKLSAKAVANSNNRSISRYQTPRQPADAVAGRGVFFAHVESDSFLEKRPSRFTDPGGTINAQEQTDLALLCPTPTLHYRRSRLRRCASRIYNLHMASPLDKTFRRVSPGAHSRDSTLGEVSAGRRSPSTNLRDPFRLSDSGHDPSLGPQPIDSPTTHSQQRMEASRQLQVDLQGLRTLNRPGPKEQSMTTTKHGHRMNKAEFAFTSTITTTGSDQIGCTPPQLPLRNEHRRPEARVTTSPLFRSWMTEPRVSDDSFANYPKKTKQRATLSNRCSEIRMGNGRATDTMWTEAERNKVERHLTVAAKLEKSSSSLTVRAHGEGSHCSQDSSQTQGSDLTGEPVRQRDHPLLEPYKLTGNQYGMPRFMMCDTEGDTHIEGDFAGADFRLTATLSVPGSYPCVPSLGSCSYAASSKRRPTELAHFIGIRLLKLLHGVYATFTGCKDVVCGICLGLTRVGRTYWVIVRPVWDPTSGYQERVRAGEATWEDRARFAVALPSLMVALVAVLSALQIPDHIAILRADRG